MVDWTYEAKVKYLEEYSSLANGRLHVNRPRTLSLPEIENYPGSISLGTYNIDGFDAGAGEDGEFTSSDILEILNEANVSGLEPLNRKNLDILIREVNSGEALWGFSFEKDSKLWIPKYDPDAIPLTW